MPIDFYWQCTLQAVFQELFVDSHVELLYMIEVEDVGLGVTAPAAVKVNQVCMIFTSSFSLWSLKLKLIRREKDIGSRKKFYAEFKNFQEKIFTVHKIMSYIRKFCMTFLYDFFVWLFDLLELLVFQNFW